MIILATTSRHRIGLFEKAGIPFKAVGSDVDEYAAHRPSDPTILPIFLATLKTKAVAQDYPDDIVLGFDTINVFSGKILEKPKLRAEARNRLLSYRGKTIAVHTGICVIKGKEKKTHLSVGTFTLRNLSEWEIDRYLNADDGYLTRTCAFNTIHPLSADFVEKVEGSMMNYLHGFPVKEVLDLVKNLS